MKLTISTFNIRNYGLGGSYNGRMGNEGRHPHIKKIINENLLDCDVMVFQEIFDLEFFKNLIPTNYGIKTYKNKEKRHQYVVVCFKDEFTFEDPLDSDHLLKGTALNYKSSRPALYGLLTDKTTRKPLIYIVGVHLKSGSEHSKNRVLQAEVIRNYLNDFEQDIPKLVTGDFNSQSKFSTYKELDDIENLNTVFKEAYLKKIKNPLPTFKTSWESHDLDHFWISENLKTDEESWVYDPREYVENEDQKLSLNAYYNEVSDHVPVKISIEF
jgi:hypothetical protein